MFDDGVFESNTIWADDIRINNEIIFGFRIANGHGFVPDFFAITWFVVHAGNDGGK